MGFHGRWSLDRIHEYWICFGGVHRSPWEVEFEWNGLRLDRMKVESMGGGVGI